MAVRGDHGARHISVEGWVREPFAIDERENHTWFGDNPRRGKVWCITHLPTGFAARFVIGSRKRAQELADELLAAADWNFTDPGEGKSLGKAVATVMKRNPNAFVESGEAGPPRAAP